jgi:ferredoxin--NADP+ reductase
MFEVVERSQLVPNLHLFVVRAPEVAAKVQPGHFVIVRADEAGERVPLTVADWDRQGGTVSTVFMEVGRSTHKLAQLQAGDAIPTFVGPLGNALEMEHFGTVLCVGGCYGIANVYPLARALKEKGNRIINLVEGRSGFLLYWEEKLKAVGDRTLFTTRDGSVGRKGVASAAVREILEQEKIDRVYVFGCTFLMYEVANATRPSQVKTMVSLNPIMMDGTGMCGACRVSIGGQTKFACVDGPEFDGHEVDWDLLLQRRTAYMPQETISAER